MVSVSTQQQHNNLLVQSEFAPEDTVSVIAFHPDRNLNIFAVGSWDCTVKIFEIIEESFKTQGIGIISSSYGSKSPAKQLFTHKFDAPILEMRWTITKDSLLVVTGEGVVSMISIPSMKVTPILKSPTTLFATAVMIGNNPMIVTVGCDSFIRYWTAQDTSKPIKETKLDHAPLCVDSNANFLLIGCSHSYLAYVKFCEPDNIFLTTPGIEMIPSVIHLSPSTHDFLMGSIDGRVLVAEFTFHGDSKLNSVNRKIAFKAHKDEPERAPKKLFHLNSISFPDFTTCKTNLVHSSASEGILKIWDLTKKETTLELKYSGLFGQITCSTLSPNLKYAVVCCGYDWCQGIWGINRPNSRNSGDPNSVCIVITPISIEIPRTGILGM